MQIIAKKGVNLYRDFYIDMDVKPYFVPPIVKIPLGYENENILIKKNIGDNVDKYDIIAYAKNDIPVYSNVCGKIIDIFSSAVTENGVVLKYIAIETYPKDIPSHPLWSVKADYTKKEILDIIKKAGIFNEVFSDYFIDSINPMTKYKKLIIDCVDEQPYDLSKTAIFTVFKNEVVKGAKILAKAFSIPNIELLIMKNFRTEDIIKEKTENINTVIVGGKYPVFPEIVQYAHKNIALRVGVECCRAVYRAAFFGEPQISHTVTVWGEGVEKPAVFDLLEGTPIKDVLDISGAVGFIERVVSGGVMQGYVANTELPVCRWETALTVMRLKNHNKTFPCVNCGKCAEVCPMQLAPFFILRSSKKIGENIAKQLCAGMCIYCGACSYICPSRQPLSEKIREYNNVFRGNENV